MAQHFPNFHVASLFVIALESCFEKHPGGLLVPLGVGPCQRPARWLAALTFSIVWDAIRHDA